MTPIGSFALVTLAVLIGGLPRDSQAESISSRSVTTNVSSEVHSTLETTQEEALASAWGLKREEWTRYRALMRGPLGIYSPNLDPLTALGIEARSAADRTRYAELQARMEGVRVEKLLAYQRAYDEAWKRLYPTLERVSLTPRHSPLQTPLASARSSHLEVFIKDDCPPCDARVRTLAAEGRAFDIYMIGSRGDDAAIRAWASRVGIDPEKVRERTITLNHDAGRWLSIGDRGALPAVLREVDGRWRRE